MPGILCSESRMIGMGTEIALAFGLLTLITLSVFGCVELYRVQTRNDEGDGGWTYSVESLDT